MPPWLIFLTLAALFFVVIPVWIVINRKIVPIPGTDRALFFTPSKDGIKMVKDNQGRVFHLHEPVWVKKSVDLSVPADSVGQIISFLSPANDGCRTKCVEVWFETLGIVRVMDFYDIEPMLL